MPEHYTKNTVEVSVWCNKCGKATRHRVDDGRRGPCLECLNKPTAPPPPPAPTQGRLF